MMREGCQWEEYLYHGEDQIGGHNVGWGDKDGRYNQQDKHNIVRPIQILVAVHSYQESSSRQIGRIFFYI